jgi:hypothetical protein
MQNRKKEMLHSLAALRDEGEKLDMPLFVQLLDMAIEDLCENIDGVTPTSHLTPVPNDIAMNYFAQYAPN